MAGADIQPATFWCRVEEIAADVVRVWLSGEVDALTSPVVGDTLRASQETAAVTVLDVRAASMNPVLRDLIEAADARAGVDGRRLLILEQPAPGAPSELAALELTARLMTIADLDLDLGAAAALRPVVPAGRGERVVVDVEGALDTTRGLELDAQLAAHAAHGRSVVLDLRAVESLDSTGIRILIDAFARARERGLGFELLAGDAVKRTLAMADLRQHLEPLRVLADEHP